MTTALLTPPEAPRLCRRSWERSLLHRGKSRDQGSPARNPQLGPSRPPLAQAGGRRGGNDRISLRILGHSLAIPLLRCLLLCSQGGQLPVPPGSAWAPSKGLCVFSHLAGMWAGAGSHMCVHQPMSSLFAQGSHWAPGPSGAQPVDVGSPPLLHPGSPPPPRGSL